MSLRPSLRKSPVSMRMPVVPGAARCSYSRCCPLPDRDAVEARRRLFGVAADPPGDDPARPERVFPDQLGASGADEWPGGTACVEHAPEEERSEQAACHDHGECDPDVAHPVKDAPR